MTPEHIGERYGITPGQAELVYTALALIQHILTLTNAKKIISPKIESVSYTHLNKVPEPALYV